MPSSPRPLVGLLGKLNGFIGVFLGDVGKLNGVRIIAFARLGHGLLEVLVGEVVFVGREFLGPELFRFRDFACDAVDLHGVDGAAAAQRRDRHGQSCHRSELSEACFHPSGHATKRAKTASTAAWRTARRQRRRYTPTTTPSSMVGLKSVARTKIGAICALAG